MSMKDELTNDELYDIQKEQERGYEYGKYCGEHPGTKRQKDVMISDHRGNYIILGEGLSISVVECEHRIKTLAGWQSYCSRQDKITKGCEKA